MTQETRTHRLKRLQMRSMRRGIKEMDILLMAFSKVRLESMTEAELCTYDELLHENDQDLYQWVTGQVAAPDLYRDLIDDIAQTFQK